MELTPLQTTSITVSPLTLKWTNAVKSYFEYNCGNKLTLDWTVLFAMIFLDHMIREQDFKEKTDFETFVGERSLQLMGNMNQMEVADVVKSIQPFIRQCFVCGQRTKDGKCKNPNCRVGIKNK